LSLTDLTTPMQIVDGHSAFLHVNTRLIGSRDQLGRTVSSYTRPYRVKWHEDQVGPMVIRCRSYLRCTRRWR
jgi:hypothetical protein